MKTLLKKAITALAAAVGISTAAVAATPVAVWDGDFSTTITGYTLDLNGNSEKDGVITISQSQGVKVNWSTAMTSGMTVLFKYSNLTLGSQQTIATSCIASDGTGDRTGVYLDANNKSHGIWNNTSTFDTSVTTQETMTDAQLSGVFALTYKGGSGTYLYRVANAACKCIYGNPKLMASGDGSIYGCTVGGTRGTTFAAASGLKISAIAVFNKVLSADEMTEYKFPSQVEKKEISVTEDSVWSDLIAEFEDPSDCSLTVKVTGTPTITLDDASKFKSITFTGAPVFAVEDSVYVNGCWLKTLLQADALDIGDATFDAIPTDFSGAYTVTSTAVTLRAQNREVISINVAGGKITASGQSSYPPEASPTENMVPDDGNYYGVAPTLGGTWNNIDKKWKNYRTTVTLKGSIASAPDGTTVQRPSIDLSATAGTTWQADISNPFLRGYLDDGGGVQVAVHGIPYTKYDVIVYMTSDSASVNLAPVTINGTTYTYVDGELVEGNTAWGKPLCNVPAIGDNAIYIKDCTGDTLTIAAERVNQGKAGDGRGTICAVQVICQGEVAKEETFTATIGESTSFKDITWDEEKTFVEGQLNVATVTVNDESEDEVEITFDKPDMMLAKLEVLSDRDIKFSADAALSNVGQFVTTGCTAKVTYNLPVNAVATSEKGVVYSGGTAGDAAVGIANNGGTLTLTGGTYKLSETHSDVDVVYNVTDSTLNYSDCIGLGKGEYNFGGTTEITAQKFVLVQGGDGNDDTFTLSGNSTMTVSGTTVEDSNQNSVLFGHWNGNSTFTMCDKASFTAEGTQVLVGKTGGDHTINLEGGNFTAMGITASASATGTNTLNLDGGTLHLGSMGIYSYSKSTKIDVNVTEDSTIISTAKMPITQPMTIAAGKTLTLDATEGDMIISGAIDGEGSVVIVGGNVTFFDTTKIDPTKVTVESGTVFYGAVVNINNMGKYTPVPPLTTDDVKLYDEAGNEIEAEVVGDHFEWEWKYTGTAAWWDFQFDGNLNNAGAGKPANLTWDGGSPIKEADAYATDSEGEPKALKIPCRPYCGPTYPDTLTVVMYGKMVSSNNTVQVGLGSLTGGTKYSLFLATGDVAKNEVKLCLAHTLSEGKAATVLCEMTVPNAQTSNHLYAFVLKTVDGNTVIDTYLDGTLLQPYTHSGKIALGTGFQVGSIHGGVGDTGYSRPTGDDAEATLEFLLAYDVELNSAVMQRLAKEYPYISTSGEATRTFTEDGGSWEEESCWHQVLPSGEENDQDAPNANTTVKVTVEGEAGIEMNLSTQAAYEKFSIEGDGILTLFGGEDAVVPVVTGSSSIGADMIVVYDCFKFGGSVDIAADKTLTFDFSTLDLSQYWDDATIKLTGIATLEEGASVEAINIDDSVFGRSAELVFNEQKQQYELAIDFDDTIPFTYVLDPGVDPKNGEWYWGEEKISVEVANLHMNTPVEKMGHAVLTNAVNRSWIITEGGIVANSFASGMSVTVNPGMFLDIYGQKANELNLTLNGGKVCNTGADYETKNQIKTVTLTADSEMEVEHQYHIYGADYTVATSIDLGEYTLTKTGSAMMQLYNCSVTGSGVLYVQEGTLSNPYSTSFDPDVTLRLGENATYFQRAAYTTTVSKIDGEGGILNIKGNISDFTLTGTLKLLNVGTYGKITLDDATLDVGKKRGFAMDGTGTVIVTLTDDEYTAGTATIYNDEVDAIDFSVLYNGEDITDRCHFQYGKLTAIDRGAARIGTTYYESLDEAIAAATTGDWIYLLLDGVIADGTTISNAINFVVGEGLTLSTEEDSTVSICVSNNTLQVTGKGSVALRGVVEVMGQGCELSLGALSLLQTVGSDGTFKVGTDAAVVLPSDSVTDPTVFASFFADCEDYAIACVGDERWRYDAANNNWRNDELTVSVKAPNGTELLYDSPIWGDLVDGETLGYQASINVATGYLFDGTWKPALPERYLEDAIYQAGSTAIVSTVIHVMPGDSHISTADTEEEAAAEVEVGIDSFAKDDLAENDVSEDTYKSYFTKNVTGESGNYTVTIVLDPAIAEQVEPKLDAAVKTITDPAAAEISVTIAAADVKPGLYYGIAVADALDGVETTTPETWKMASAAGVELSATKPSGNAGFYVIKCSPVDTNKKN